MSDQMNHKFKAMQYCVRCCTPETEDSTSFDELGICHACQSSEQKMHIDWIEREKALVKILEKAKKNAKDRYDCLIPISGGKDSTFQIYVLTKIYGMKPLAVTFNHNWYSRTGWYNLVNCLENFQVDHMMFTPGRSLVNRMARRSLPMIGDACWHCHAGLGAFPLQVAASFKIPLLVYGEPSQEGFGRGTYKNPEKFDRDYFIRISAGKYPEEMECDYLTKRDLCPFVYPEQEELDDADVRQIHLGSYLFWDDERQTEFVKNNFGWKETDMEPTFKHYKSVECVMPGVHDHLWYLKRGYARGTFHACIDVRNGLLSRDEGLILADKHDPQNPEVLDYYLSITGYSKNQFYSEIEKLRMDVLKGEEFPVHPRRKPNSERLLPYPEQLSEKYKNTPLRTDSGRIKELYDQCLSDTTGLEAFETLCSTIKRKSSEIESGYDCIVPLTGSPANYILLHAICNEYGLKPLAVVFNHGHYTEKGWFNITNILESFNLDSVSFTLNRALISKLVIHSIKNGYDPFWFWKAGFYTYTIAAAKTNKVSFILISDINIYSEQFQKENRQFDLETFENSLMKEKSNDYISDLIRESELFIFNPDLIKDKNKEKIKCIHLLDYFSVKDHHVNVFAEKVYGWSAISDDPQTSFSGMSEFNQTSAESLKEIHDFFQQVNTRASQKLLNEKINVQDLIGKLYTDDGLVKPLSLELYDKLNTWKGHPFEIKETGRLSAMPDKIPSELESFHDISISQLLSAYWKKEISPVEIARMCFKRIEKLEPETLAWECLDESVFIQQAQDAENRIRSGSYNIRVLDGIPIGIKDVFNTKDFPTQMGSELWKNFTPGNDARSVFNLKEAGAIFPGKTVTAEFAVHALGKTLNPHHVEKTPGTSSSGSAAAVAAGMIPAALGTQTAGSIIRPASFCGVYGCKPSFGLIPRTGVLKTTDSLDTIGFFTLWYEDIQRIFNILRVQGTNYPFSNEALSNNARQNKPNDRPWKIAVVKPYTWKYAEQEAKKQFDEWVGTLSELQDIEVYEKELPDSVLSAHEIHRNIYDKALAYYFQEEYKHIKNISPIMKKIINMGKKISIQSYQKALVDQVMLCQDMDRFFSDCDAMVTLSTAGVAPDRKKEEEPDSALIWTLTHLPVISAPVFTSSKGLPFGLQIASKRYNDILLFNATQYFKDNGIIPAKANPKIF